VNEMARHCLQRHHDIRINEELFCWVRLFCFRIFLRLGRLVNLRLVSVTLVSPITVRAISILRGVVVGTGPSPGGKTTLSTCSC